MVEGSFNNRPVGQIGTSVVSHSTPGPSSGNRPIFSAKKEISAKVKVVQATLRRAPSGKAEFTRENQTYVTVSEATANVDYVQRKWGFNYVLVTSDGLKLDDSAQGIYKSYAV